MSEYRRPLWRDLIPALIGASLGGVLWWLIIGGRWGFMAATLVVSVVAGAWWASEAHTVRACRARQRKAVRADG